MREVVWTILFNLNQWTNFQQHFRFDYLKTFTFFFNEFLTPLSRFISSPSPSKSLDSTCNNNFKW